MSAGHLKEQTETRMKQKQLTLRSIIFGSLGSIIITTSSIYIALRMGSLPWPTIFVAILSMTLLKGFGQTNQNEINVTHTAMSAGAMVAGGLAFTIPGIWIIDRKMDIGYGIVAFIAIFGTVLGLIFTFIMRKHFIEHKKYQYPIGTAAAETVKAGYNKEKGKYLFSMLGLSAIFTAARDGLKIIPSTWEATSLASKNIFLGARISPMAIGIGYIIGPKHTSVWFLGALISYLGIIPIGLSQEWFVNLDVAESFKNSLGIGLMVGAGIAIIFKDILPQAKHIYRSIFTQKGAEKWLPLIFAFMALLLTVLTGMGFMLSVLTITGVWLTTSMSATITGQTGINPMNSFAIIVLLAIKAFIDLGGSTAIFVAAIVAVACGLTGDVLNDYKAGYILKTDPKSQFVSEAIGGIIGAVVATAVLFIMLSAFKEIGPGTELPAPQAFATSSLISGIPHMKAFLTGLFIGIILYMLNFPAMMLGLGIYLPVFISSTAFIGGLIHIIVKKVFKMDQEDKGVIVASGLLGGEGVTGVAVAITRVISGT